MPHPIRPVTTGRPALLLVSAALLVGGCEAPSPSLAPSLSWTDCEMITAAPQGGALFASLPALHRRIGGQDLLIVNGLAFRSTCSTPARLGSSTESARLGGAGEDARLGGTGEDARLGGTGEDARLGGAGEDARLGSAGEDARLGGADEDARLGAAGEDARLGGSGEDARLSGAGEAARVGGYAAPLQCASVTDSPLGYLVRSPIPRPVYVFDGVQLWRLDREGRAIVEVDSLPVPSGS